MGDPAVLDMVREHMKGLKVPSHYDKVYKEECMFCFATPESPGGLFINLTTFQAFDQRHVQLDQERTGAVLYLQEQSHRVPLSEEELKAQEAKPERLALGMEGGFCEAKSYREEKESALVLMPAQLRVPLPCPELPELVLSVIAAVQAHDSATQQDKMEAWQEERAVSKYAEGLEQLPATRKVPMDPKQWRCEETGVSENLWLNLSTGFIGSGRPHWDGSGGNGAAMRHFEATGNKYPLVVKLGTITPHGADVYSYAPDEDEMVTDPLLGQHLAHWGINMLQMEKTEKTMAELQIEKNLAHEFDTITEAGAKLKQLSGPGYVGLKNLGNSCYMNSVLQVLWTLPELHARYVEPAARLFRSAAPEVASDFAAQFAKVGVALVAGQTGQGHAAGVPPVGYEATTVITEGGLETVAQERGAAPEEGGAVSPQMFKTLVGRGHAEFSSARQQDAEEYWGHLLEVMARAERAAGDRLPGAAQHPTASLFGFQTEDRIQCMETSKVSYKRGSSTLLGLDIPLEAATNREELDSYQEREQKRAREEEERVVPRVPLAACLEQYAADRVVEDYQSAAAGRRTRASKRVRLSSFPPYLLLQLRRYYVDAEWRARKMEVQVDVPDRLSLEALRGLGPQPGEELQPEDGEAGAAAAAAAAAPTPPNAQPDEGIVVQLVSMGFSENGSKRAAVATNNSGAEAAMEWVLSHMGDPNFNDPLPAEGGSAEGGPPPAASGDAAAVSPEALSMLTGMGFSDRQAQGALAACQGSVERAADWLFSHMDDLDASVEAALAPAGGSTGGGGNAVAASGSSAAKAAVLDGPGEYELVGFISHMGANTACGHYVCHIKKEGRWVIYNDEKVALSERPPLDLGYLYLFQRVES